MAFDLNKFMQEHPNSKITSAYLKLNLSDWQKGLIIAFFSPIVYQIGDAIMSWINNVPVTIDWRHLLGVAVAAGVTYLGKNLTSPATIKIPVTDAQQKVDAALMPETNK